MITVLLVDSCFVDRQAVRDILERDQVMLVIGEAANGEDAVAETKRLNPTVVVMDFDLPSMSGTEATTVIRLQCPEATIIGLKAGVPEDAEYAMIHAGAAAILNKKEIMNILLQPLIVQAVAASKNNLLPMRHPGFMPRCGLIELPGSTNEYRAG